jgi:hypothetical protein
LEITVCRRLILFWNKCFQVQYLLIISSFVTIMLNFLFKKSNEKRGFNLLITVQLSFLFYTATQTKIICFNKTK